MPQCPNCKKEYSEGAKVCAACGQSLSSDSEAFLTSAGTGFESDMLEGSLRTAGIPYIKKGHSGPEGFARYDTSYKSLGVDFYVPAALLDRAKRLLPDSTAAALSDEVSTPDNVADDNENSDFALEKGEDDTSNAAKDNTQMPEEKQQTKPLTRVALTILFILIIALAVWGVDFLMNLYRSAMGYNG